MDRDSAEKAAAAAGSSANDMLSFLDQLTATTATDGASSAPPATDATKPVAPQQQQQSHDVLAFLEQLTDDNGKTGAEETQPAAAATATAAPSVAAKEPAAAASGGGGGGGGWGSWWNDIKSTVMQESAVARDMMSKTLPMESLQNVATMVRHEGEKVAKTLPTSSTAAAARLGSVATYVLHEGSAATDKVARGIAPTLGGLSSKVTGLTSSLLETIAPDTFPEFRASHPHLVPQVTLYVAGRYGVQQPAATEGHQQQGQQSVAEDVQSVLRMAIKRKYNVDPEFVRVLNETRGYSLADVSGESSSSLDKCVQEAKTNFPRFTEPEPASKDDDGTIQVQLQPLPAPPAPSASGNTSPMQIIGTDDFHLISTSGNETDEPPVDPTSTEPEDDGTRLHVVVDVHLNPLAHLPDTLMYFIQVSVRERLRDRQGHALPGPVNESEEARVHGFSQSILVGGADGGGVNAEWEALTVRSCVRYLVEGVLDKRGSGTGEAKP
ncbi:hypothetical protein RI367_000977 [Sorochytrium milnesiophthora]